MAIARLPVILILILHLLEGYAQGQQLSLTTQPAVCLSSNPTDDKIAVLISNTKNQTPKCNNGNTGSSVNSQSKKMSGLQQFLSMQQPPQSQQQNLQLNILSQPAAQSTGSPNQPQNLNLQNAQLLQLHTGQNQQPTTSVQNLQQPTGQNLQQITPQNLHQITEQQLQQIAGQNLQQPINLQELVNQNTQQCVNLQQSDILRQIQTTQQMPNVQQPQPQSQQFVLQQQSTPFSNLQVKGQQEIPLQLLPMINGQVQGLPSQVTQGVLLSNLGLTSALPSILPTTSCSYSNQPVEQVSVHMPQNNITPISNTPLVLFDGFQLSNSLPNSPSHSCVSNDCGTSSLSEILPFDFQPNLAVTPMVNVQYQQSGDQKVTHPIQRQSTQAQCLQTVPVQMLSDYAPQAQLQTSYTQQLQAQPGCVKQTQAVPIQITQPQSVPTQFVQTEPIISQAVQAQPNLQNQASSFQSQLSPTQITNDPSNLSSFLLSQLQPSSSNSQLSSPFPTGSNQSPKSSGMRALLPLLFNLLKEKNGGCGCPPNCNCGCMNNNNYPVQDCQGRNVCVNNNNRPMSDNGINYRSTKEPIVQSKDVCNNENGISKNSEIVDGYANQIKYGQPQDKQVQQNIIDSEEINVPKKVQEKKKYEKCKAKKMESEEYEDDDFYVDSYEFED